MRGPYSPVAAQGDLSEAKKWGVSYTIPEEGEDGLYAGNNTHKHSNKEDQVQRKHAQEQSVRPEASRSEHKPDYKNQLGGKCRNHVCILKKKKNKASCLKVKDYLLYRMFGSHS